MKKMFLALAVCGMFMASISSCSKCGHCEQTLTYKEYIKDYDEYDNWVPIDSVIKTETVKGETYCGNDNKESGAGFNAMRINCERVGDWYENNPQVLSYESKWVDDK